MKDFFKLAFILFVTCVISAGSLSFVNQVTKEPIAKFESVEKETAQRAVFKDINGIQPAALTFVEQTGDKVWQVMNGNDRIGTVILVNFQGYSGPITMMVGVDPQNKITGVRILSQTETPGLGARIIQPSFYGQFMGKDVGQLALKKDDPAKGTVDAITGATISSRAVTKALAAEITALGQPKPATAPAAEGKK